MIYCVTGPMAAGKNIVSQLLENKGYISIDADILIHKAILSACSKIIETFKEDAKKEGIILQNNDGTLNRRELGKLIFPKPELLKKQERLVYPIIIDETKRIIEKNSNKNIIINATVLYKTPEIMKLCSKIFYVDSPILIRFLRTKSRDKMKTKQILQRFHSQKTLMKEYKKTGIPIIRINNINSINTLNKKIDKLLISI